MTRPNILPASGRIQATLVHSYSLQLPSVDGHVSGNEPHIVRVAGDKVRSPHCSVRVFIAAVV